MNRHVFPLTILALVVASTVILVAAAAALDQQDSAAVNGAPATQRLVAVNKFCPIHRDNPVDPSIPCVIYRGKAIGFCCPDCIDEFNKDPDKYVANLK